MLPRAQRLSRAEHVLLRTQKVVRTHGEFFLLTSAPQAGRKAKFSCVVPKKAVSKAHERNLIKRRARAAFRASGIFIPHTFVFTAKRSASQASYQEILADMQKVLKKAIT